MFQGPHVRVRSLDAAVDVCDDLIGHVGEHILDQEVAKRQKPFVSRLIQDRTAHMAEVAAFDLPQYNDVKITSDLEPTAAPNDQWQNIRVAVTQKAYEEMK